MLRINAQQRVESQYLAAFCVQPVHLRNARQKETPAKAGVVNSLEARPGFEPGIKALQASALPLGHLAI